MPCADSSCLRPARIRGFCGMHYKRWLRRGTTHDITPEVSFFSRVTERDGCWIWGGTIEPTGYGRFQRKMAHRWAYEFMVGEIPTGLQLDHLCRVIACVNPEHLEPVTPRENVVVRGTGVSARNARKTHCIHGHAFDEANTYRTAKGQRYCRACRDAASARHAQRQKQ